FKPEWRVILPLPDDEEDMEFEPDKLSGSVVEQSTVVEEGISDFNQHSSSLEVADLEIADSIEDSLVQSQFPTETPFKNEHEPLFFDQANQDDNITFQSYELITEGRN
ncbi:hypothetical protein A2U01_0057084, partial [Trifolium medium]|nr:hypothetical protein [Trifolium medium]